MKFFSNLIKKSALSRKRAIAFVDYEHWFYSYQKIYGIKPQISSWQKELAASYQLLDIMVFGDFSPPGMNIELNKIRSVTNTIIETQNSNLDSKKDMTDFIMLDYLYQISSERTDVDTYILFTGDGHFQSVVKFITQKRKREVLVYGVKNAFSGQLRAVATKWVEYPASGELTRKYYQMIIKNFDYISSRNINPTFMKTVEAVANYNNVEQDKIKATLQEMVDRGYVYQKMASVAFNRKVKIVAANWDLLIRDGLWNPN